MDYIKYLNGCFIFLIEYFKYLKLNEMKWDISIFKMDYQISKWDVLIYLKKHI